MAVQNGQDVSAEVTNAAFISRTEDSSTVGKIALQAPNSPFIQDIQKATNKSFNTVGIADEDDANAKIYASNEVIADGDSHKVAIEKLDASFDESTGHSHDGTMGQGPKLTPEAITGYKLKAKYRSEAILATITGSSVSLTAELMGFQPSNNDQELGLAVNNPFNYAIIRGSDGKPIVDSMGYKVFGRLTYAAPDWFLNTFSAPLGVETGYTFSMATPVMIYLHEVYDPLTTEPVYDADPFTRSEVATFDVDAATAIKAGLVKLSAIAPSPIAMDGSAGISTDAARADHTHKGVGSAAIAGSADIIYGDFRLLAGSNITLEKVGNAIQINGQAGGSGGSVVGIVNQEQLMGVTDGVNLTFGPLSIMPVNTDSVVIAIDGLAMPRASYTINGLNEVIFAAGYAPVLGQTVYAYYIIDPNGTVAKYEDASETVNGINAEFTISLTPKDPAGLAVFIDGILMPKEAYTFDIALRKITFEPLFIPVFGQNVSAFYQRLGGELDALQEPLDGVTDGVNTVFGPMSFQANEIEAFAVFIDGVFIHEDAYAIAARNVVFDPAYAPNAGQRVDAYYFYAGNQSAFRTDYFTLDAAQVAAKQVKLSGTPASPKNVLLDGIRFGAFEYTVDFKVTGDILSWNGLGFTAEATVGRKIRVSYLL